MTYVVIARWTAMPGKEQTVADALTQLIGPSRAEPGNLAYQIHRSSDDPRVFLLYEKYIDEDAYQAHGASEHFRRFGVEGGIPHLESREREFLYTWEGEPGGGDSA